MTNSDQPKPRLTLRNGETGDSVISTFYDQVGGEAVFRGIVSRFYASVREDPLLFEMYPKEDMAGAEDRLRMFLEQYWGGPATYSEQRGHPRLYLRHTPFRVDAAARDRWLTHMRAAVEAANLSSLHESTMLDYFERAAHAMVNTQD